MGGAEALKEQTLNSRQYNILDFVYVALPSQTHKPAIKQPIYRNNVALPYSWVMCFDSISTSF